MQDPYDNLVTVATGFKNWKIWKISRAEFMALQAKVPSAKLEEGLNINTFDPFDSKTAEFRHLLPFFTEVKVMPGDLLYVPPVCVHEVLSAPQTVGSTAMSNPKTKDPFAMGAPPSGHDLMDTSK
jgi:ribosomal protein L16 Arg81 hydroxylase